MAEFYSKTGNDNKDHNTGVYVYVKNENNTTILAKIEDADNSSTDATEYNDGSEHIIKLIVMKPEATKETCQHFNVLLKSKATGNDNWNIEIAQVILYFTDGTNIKKETHNFSLNSRGSNFAEINF